MSMSWTPFSHKQLVTISQDLSQAIHDDPALIALFMGQAPPTTPRTAPTPGPLRDPQANPPCHHRNPCTMLTSTHFPQQAINFIPSMNKPCITVTLTIPDAITGHVIGCAGM